MTEMTALPPESPPSSESTGRWFAGRRLSGRWVAAGGTAVLAAVVGVALAVQYGAGAACAAPPTGTAEHRGKATFYQLGGGTGNCSAQAPADRLFVALGPSEYAGAAACGGYLDVTGPKGKVRVKITDQCPECAPGHLDLSREAFTKIADPVQGRVPVSYRAAVNAAVPGPLSFRIKEGSSQFWFAVLVDNHANPLRSVEVKGARGGFRPTDRKDFNYWIADGGLGSGPFSIRVTDVYGRQATATGVTLSPGVVQGSGVRMAGGAAAPPAAPSRPTREAAPPPPPRQQSANRPAAPRPAATRAATAPSSSPAAKPAADAPVTDAVPPAPAGALPDGAAPAGAPGGNAPEPPAEAAGAPAGQGTRVALTAGKDSCR